MLPDNFEDDSRPYYHDDDDLSPHCVAGGSRCSSFSRRQAELRHARGWWHSKVRDIFLKQSCRRKALNAAFTLSNVHSEDFFLWILPEQISKYLHSGFYDAGEYGQKVCLELSCAVGSLCRCSECLCCFVLPGFHLRLQLHPPTALDCSAMLQLPVSLRELPLVSKWISQGCQVSGCGRVEAARSKLL